MCVVCVLCVVLCVLCVVCSLRRARGFSCCLRVRHGCSVETEAKLKESGSTQHQVYLYINSSSVVFQVVIEAVDETGAVLPEAVSAGASAELTKDFTTGK